MEKEENKYELIKFEEGELSLDVNVSPSEETVWLNIQQITDLFEKSRATITEHIQNIFTETELNKNQVCRKFRQTGSDGKTYNVNYYNFDMILAVGYRVNSKRGIEFRRWASNVLKEHLKKGYSINEKRCLECSENLVTLNNEINRINNRLNKIEEKPQNEFIFYEGELFEPYSFIKKLFLSAKEEIIIIDGYINIDVLDMLSDIKISIIIYTFDSAPITKLDINKFEQSHILILKRTSKIHDRFIIIDGIVYMIGSSIKDIGKKRTSIIKMNIEKDKLINDL